MIRFKPACCSPPRRLSTRLSIRSIRRFSSTTTYKSVLSTVKPSSETVASLRSGSPSLPTWWHWRFFPVRDEAADFNGGTIGRMNARAGVGLRQQVSRSLVRSQPDSPTKSIDYLRDFSWRLAQVSARSAGRTTAPEGALSFIPGSAPFSPAHWPVPDVSADLISALATGINLDIAATDQIQANRPPKRPRTLLDFAFVP